MELRRCLLIFSVTIFTLGAIAQNNVGIGTNTPTQKLDIDGQIRIRGGAPGAGKVLTSSADGTASWATPSSGSNWTVVGDNIIRNTGFVGVGSVLPTALFSVNSTGASNHSVVFVSPLVGNPGPPPVSGQGSRLMWYGDKRAFRVGFVSGTQWDMDSIGFSSVAMGQNSRAIGDGSFAIGNVSRAAGVGSISLGQASEARAVHSIAIGESSLATGAFSHAFGASTHASGDGSTALGWGTQASSAFELALGRFNSLYTPLSTTQFNNADRLFVVGNGVDINNRSDALVIMKHGGIGLGISNPAAFSNLHLHNKNADQVFQRFTNSVTGTGITDGLSIGIRDNTHNGLIMNNENGTLLFGTHNVVRMIISNTGNVGIGNNSPTALLHVDGIGAGQGNILFTGTFTQLNPVPPPTTGEGTRMMWYPERSAFRVGSVSGTQWDAPNTGNFSVAFGYNTLASGENSSAFGTFTKAEAYRSTAFGYYNVGGGNSSSTVASNPLFEIGNGGSNNSRNNAFTVLQNGRIGINVSLPTSQLEISAPSGVAGLRVMVNNETKLRVNSNGGLSVGTLVLPPPFNGLNVRGESILESRVLIGVSDAAPDATLDIRHTNPPAGIMPNQGLRIQNVSGTNRLWTLYTFSSNGALALYSATGGAVSVGNFNAGTGAYTATSNRHLKTNVQLLDADILTRIQQLQPASYSYLRDPLQQRTVGFMAEDVQPLFPELVDTIGENGENLAINYAGFSVVAIKAIQLLEEKQQDQLQKQHNLEKELAAKEKRITTLENDVQEMKQLLNKINKNE